MLRRLSISKSRFTSETVGLRCKTPHKYLHREKRRARRFSRLPHDRSLTSSFRLNEDFLVESLRTGYSSLSCTGPLLAAIGSRQIYKCSHREVGEFTSSRLAQKQERWEVRDVKVSCLSVDGSISCFICKKQDQKYCFSKQRTFLFLLRGMLQATLYSRFIIFCRLSFFFDSFFLPAGSSSTAPPVRVRMFSFSLKISSMWHGDDW